MIWQKERLDWKKAREQICSQHECFNMCLAPRYLLHHHVRYWNCVRFAPHIPLSTPCWFLTLSPCTSPLTTLVDILNLRPCFSSMRMNVRRTSLSIVGTILSRNSTTVTCTTGAL